MAQDFDNFPLYDPIVRSGSNKLSDVWMSSMATFMDTLISYLTQNGIFVPRITTDQRNALQNVQNGQLIYNSSTNKFQGYENGSWQNLI